MLCEECGQNNASVAITVLTGGENTTKHLCEDCMEKLKAEFAKGDIQHFLSALLSTIATQKPELPEVLCSRCGLSFKDFKRSGKLGCAQCYTDFEEYLRPMLQRIHGRSQHSGSVPAAMREEQQKDKAIADLRARMDTAVEKEDFEEAAYLRDQIRALTRSQG